MRDQIPSYDYHSALTADVPAAPVRRWDQWDTIGCLAFVHDLMTSPDLPDVYDRCDVLVTDLPWQTGFAKFNARAGVKDDGRTYAKFMRRIGEIVEASTVPAYLVTGRHALPKLPPPAAVLPTLLNRDAAVVICYNPGPEADGRYGVAQEFLRRLASDYRTVGDFCCGYGRSGRFFLAQGGRAVLSDHNPRCVGYISEHAAEWVGGRRG